MAGGEGADDLGVQCGVGWMGMGINETTTTTY